MVMETRAAKMIRLSRIRLINWHYFTNETIEVKGSFLISGENTSGKSTLLDAIQLVLTTNTRKFNTAANEKSKRDLKGYVRCKTGNEGKMYVRDKGSIITYAALEFFEESKGKYFVLGTKIDSADLDSDLRIKWYVLESRFEDLQFITKGTPSTDREFLNKGKPINYIHSNKDAREQFRFRLGRLEERFFDMIPKSLAFKPMDNVKDFINKFILPEKIIEVDSLRNNIRTLKEFENLMEQTKIKIKDLELILNKGNAITDIQKEIKINELLIGKAEVLKYKNLLEETSKNIHINEKELATTNERIFSMENLIKLDRNKLKETEIAYSSNEITRLISNIENNITLLKKDYILEKESLNEYNSMIDTIENTLISLSNYKEFLISNEDLNSLKSEIIKNELNKERVAKRELLYNLSGKLTHLKNNYNQQLYKTNTTIDEEKKNESKLQAEIDLLNKNKLIYPENTSILKSAIEAEFTLQGIDTYVRVFSELLEVTDSKWQNAIEGYLNSQRFYLIVEPKYYKLALKVYQKLKNKIHSVGLVNTEKLKLDSIANTNSLAYVVKSDNRYARSYANYLLNRVDRCENIDELKNYKIAITQDCFLYQNFAVRKIDPKIYNTPYIGAYALKIQLANKQKELANLRERLRELSYDKNQIKAILKIIEPCDVKVLEKNYDSIKKFYELSQNIKAYEEELKKANDHPSIMELRFKIEELELEINVKEKELNKLNRNIGNLENHINFLKNSLITITDNIKIKERDFQRIINENINIRKEGEEKFYRVIKDKTPEDIVKNFETRNTGLNNKVNDLEKDLFEYQSTYCSKHESDLIKGYDALDEYIKEHNKLVASEIVKNEENLNNAMKNCEIEFKESFLAKLKENIENARLEFNQLNKALSDIYYGEDSYQFKIMKNKGKETLYEMIVSAENLGGYNLWTNIFEDKYKEEINDLFAKLTVDDKGEKVLSEYTDYRNYLDYDIIVNKKDGAEQRFSKIYGEKSGGETQTPYYVAIAASLVQLYSYGETIRIIMLDEAFDKMDDNRIESMMDFFNSQNFQIILATPPAKIEIIGEHVDTILLAIRDGSSSIIEEYDL